MRAMQETETEGIQVTELREIDHSATADTLVRYVSDKKQPVLSPQDRTDGIQNPNSTLQLN